MDFRFSDDYRARLLALPRMVQRGRGASEGAAGALKGGRIEFQDHRPYVPGDDLRDLDWHAWLRHDALVTKEYSKDDAPEVVVVLDRSASMGEAGSGKDRIAREICGALVYLGLTSRCPSSVMVLAQGGPVTVGSWRSHRKLDRVLGLLEGLGPCGGGTWLSGLRHLRGASAAGRVVFLVSDYLVDPLPAEILVALSGGAGTGCLLHLVSGEERRPGLPESCTLTDPESSGRLFVPDGRALLEAYARELTAHEGAVTALAARHGLGSVICSDDVPFERTMRTVLARSGSRA